MSPFIHPLLYLSVLGSTGWGLELLIIQCPSSTDHKSDSVAYQAVDQKWAVGNFIEHRKKPLLWYALFVCSSITFPNMCYWNLLLVVVSLQKIFLLIIMALCSLSLSLSGNVYPSFVDL